MAEINSTTGHESEVIDVQGLKASLQKLKTNHIDKKADTNSLGTAATKNVPTSGDATTTQVVMGDDTRLTDSRKASDVSEWAKADTKPTYTASEVGAIPTNEKGAVNGVASLDSSGKVPQSQLPSYVDDVLEYDTKSAFPETGEGGKIYVDKSNSTTWRWSGSTYTQIKGDLAIGTTSGTAADGKVVNDHINNTSNPHGVTKEQVGLGNVGNFKAVSTVASQGLTDTEKSNARANIGAGTVTGIKVGSSGTEISPSGGVVTIPSYESGAQVHKAPTASEVKSALGTGSGTTKFLREDGTWQKPEGGSAAAYTPTLASAPTESTTTYTKDGVTVSFEVGQFARVASADSDTGYVFYMLHDISGGKAVWAEMGTPLERVRVTVASNQTSDVQALRNAAIVTVTSDKYGEIYSGRVDGDAVTVAKVEPGDTYTVTASDVDGYKTPASQTFKAELNGINAVEMTYHQTIITVGVTQSGGDDSDVSGVKPIVNGTAVSQGASVGVATGSTVTISWPAVDGYKTPTNDTSFTAAGTAMSKTGQYQTTKYTVSVTSNQNDDTAITSKQVTVNYGSASKAVSSGQTVKVPTGTTPTATAPDVTGYKKTVTISGTTIMVAYSTCKLMVSLTSDTGEADLSGVTITVTDTTASAVVAAQQDGTYKIPTGHGYSVAVSDDVEGYKAPATATGTASGASASVTMTYEEQAGFVDLGLTSGLKWAQANIVKDAQGNYAIGENPEDYGCYFSWGNIVGHNNGEGYDFGTRNSGPYASTPGKQVSANIASNDAQHDAALALLGSPWRLPTKEEFQELYDNTDREWTTINGINGWKFMKKTDHSVFVFFPAAGYGYGTSLYDVGSKGGYWSSSWLSADRAYLMYFDSSSVTTQDNFNRYNGFSVRAVQ